MPKPDLKQKYDLEKYTNDLYLSQKTWKIYQKKQMVSLNFGKHKHKIVFLCNKLLDWLRTQIKSALNQNKKKKMR